MSIMRKCRFRAYFAETPEEVWDLIGPMEKSMFGWDEVQMVHYQDDEHAAYIAEMYRRVGTDETLVIELLNVQGEKASAYAVDATLVRYRPSELEAADMDPSVHTLWIQPTDVKEIT
jgi:hypothetical protein